MVNVSPGLTTLPRAAVMLHIPVPTPVARPPAATLAIELFEEAHVTLEVRFCVLELLYVPMAVNCWVVPLGIEGLVGVTAMDTRVGGVTVSVVDPLIPPNAALMPDVPAVTPVARPLGAMVATLVLLELQAT
jgi:hypothetical protein